MNGTVVAVCISHVGNLPKHAQPRVTVGTHGLEDDYHNRELRPSFSNRGTFKPNIDRHISLVAIEVIEEMAKLLGKTLGPGALGENITTRGMGDLSQIADGTRIMVGNGVVLRVSQQNAPCKNVRAAYGLEGYQFVEGRRGLLCSIERGFQKIIEPEDHISLLL